MKSWKRITLVIFVLIGGTTSFGYWVINQFDLVLDNLSASYFANINSVYPIRGNASNGVYPSFEQNTELASTSPETLVALATSTSSTSSPQVGSPQQSSGQAGQATPTDPKLSLTFPQKDTGVYIGCTYPISWQSSTMISSLEAALIDAGAREAVEPKRSGLAKENTIEKESQNLNWKVGFSVWPGAYYIKVSKIDGVEAEFRSKVFEIKKMPEGVECG
ncbi:MAG: hypothetical protein HYT65_01125 [Candidatus Yanofskybacteria bacterium]|nr:hypothetical protein [Candidatus Yanofskybacteria bacterium]